MSDAFGDYEAEDAWDASDDFSTHVDNLIERLDQLDGLPAFTHATRTAADLDTIEERLHPWLARRAQLDDHMLERVVELQTDLAALRDEIAGAT
jgi:bacterioferritin (cytochrome b1)